MEQAFPVKQIIRQLARAASAGLLAAACALALASCGKAEQPAFGPSARINEADPFASLRPWNSDWRQVKKAENGVEFIIISKGDPKGAFPLPADQVEVTFDARLAETGEPVMSTNPGETMTRGVNDWIPGWTDGLPRLQPGDTAMFYIPWRRAFGRSGQGVAPPRSDIMILVSLKRIIAAKTSDPDAWKKATPWPENSQDVFRTASGLEYFIVANARPGSTAAASEGADDRPLKGGDTAVIDVEGRLEDDAHSVFESSYEDGRQRYWKVDELIPGFVEALNLMHVGDHWMVRMPPQLAYGAESNGRILPNSTLVFEIELDNIIKAAPEPAPAKIDKTKVGRTK